MAINSIQEFNGTNQEAIIPWLDNIEAIAKKIGFNLLQIGMSKLKGMALCNVNAASKEGTLLYFHFCQLLIEHYLNVPYTSNTLNTYAHLMQGENESITQYVTKAKILLECILLECIPVIRYGKFTLFKGCAHHMSEEKLHQNRTAGILWKMSSKQ